MDIQIIINQILVLFILMAVGFVISKVKVLTREGNKTLTKLVLSVTLPCTILSSVFANELEITAGGTAYFLLMSLFTISIAFIISLPVVRAMGGNKDNQGLLHFMATFGNSGFFGFPVSIAIFGISSAYYIALFSILFNVIVFSVGIIMVSCKTATDDNRANRTTGDNRAGSGFNPKSLINPTLITALSAILIALTGFKLPYVATEAIRITGNITIPGAMIIVGSSLAFVPLKTVFSEWRVIPVTLLKLVVIPFITWLILKQIITNELLLGVLVVMSAMPVATMAPILAIEYDANEQVASAGIFLSTLLCGVTIPLVVYFLLI